MSFGVGSGEAPDTELLSVAGAACMYHRVGRYLLRSPLAGCSEVVDLHSGRLVARLHLRGSIRQCAATEASLALAVGDQVVVYALQ